MLFSRFNHAAQMTRFPSSYQRIFSTAYAHTAISLSILLTDILGCFHVIVGMLLTVVNNPTMNKRGDIICS
jgi:hypothetical protein